MSEQETLLKFSQDLPEVLEQLYRTPTDLSQWQGFLRKLTDSAGARSARMLVMDKDAKRVHYSDKVNIDDDQHRDYVNHFVNLCPWRPELALKTPGRLYNTYHDFSCKQKSFYQTEFFNDWARHLDIEHGLCGTVYHDSRYTVQLLVQRTGGQGAFPKSLTAQINRLIPHVQQALHLNKALSAQRQHNVSILHAAEKAFMPFVLLNALGEVVYLCPRFEALLGRHNGIRIENGGVQLSCPQASQRLAKMVNRVVTSQQFALEPILYFRPNTTIPVRLLVEPLGASGMPEFWINDAVVAVYLQDPEQHLEVDQALLARLFGLTEAESRVGAGLALGKTVQAMADEAGTTVNTVRTQLKSVMAKTGTRRQAELVAIVLRSSAVHQLGDAAPVSICHSSEGNSDRGEAE